MQSCLDARESGRLSRDGYKRAVSTQLLLSFAPAPQLRFAGEPAPAPVAAHRHGVAALAVDKFDGRVLLSGGADGALRVWDLEAGVGAARRGRAAVHAGFVFAPTASVPRVAAPASIVPAAGMTTTASVHAAGPPAGHSHGITHLAFYPFDADAFLSSSFDKTLLLWSTTRAAPASAFPLGATIYSHSTSAVSSSLLVACATQHPAVRLVDLRSGAAIHALVPSSSSSSSTGPVLATAWSPRRDHVLVSGHADGTAAVWDVRRAGGPLALLDREDSLGVVHRARHSAAAAAASSATPPPRRIRSRASAKAHADAVNALAWTDDGLHIVSGGLDGRLRVWDAATGANTLASFGPAVRNASARHRTMVVSPAVLTRGRREVLFWPNERDVLALDLHDGRVLARLRTPGIPHDGPPPPAASTAKRQPSRASQTMRGPAPALSKHRITAIAWRGVGGHGRQSTTRMGGADATGGIFAAHADGHIRAWLPSLPGPEGDGEGGGGDDDDDDDNDNDDDDDSDDDDDGDSDDSDKGPGRRKKKRQLDNVFKSLMESQLTFSDAPRGG